VLDFLTQQGAETVLLYHCYANDGRQTVRNKLFDNWAKISGDRKHILKHSVEVAIDNNDGKQNMYLGFLTLLENPLINDLEEEFKEFSISLVTSKE